MKSYNQFIQEAKVGKLIVKKFKLGKYADKAIKAIRNRRAVFQLVGLLMEEILWVQWQE